MSRYIFKADGHPAFTPDGMVQHEMTKDDITLHNSNIAKSEWSKMISDGKGWMYLTQEGDHWVFGDWAGTRKISPWRVRQSVNNFGAERTDFWFNLDGSTWWGFCVGDTQLAKVMRTKS